MTPFLAELVGSMVLLTLGDALEWCIGFRVVQAPVTAVPIFPLQQP